PLLSGVSRSSQPRCNLSGTTTVTPARPVLPQGTRTKAAVAHRYAFAEENPAPVPATIEADRYCQAVVPVRSAGHRERPRGDPRYRGGGGVVIRPPTAPTAPPPAAPSAAPCPPAAAAPIAAPLPAPIRPPPIVRWTGSYGLVQADKPNTSPTATTNAVAGGLVVVTLHPLIGR